MVSVDRSTTSRILFPFYPSDSRNKSYKIMRNSGRCCLMSSNAAILKIVTNMNNLKMHFKIETLTQNLLSNGMETVALAFGSVAVKKKHDGLFQRNKFTISHCRLWSDWNFGGEHACKWCYFGWIHLQHTRIAVALACWNFFYCF